MTEEPHVGDEAGARHLHRLIGHPSEATGRLRTVANLVNQVLDFAEAHPGEIDVRDIASGARLRSLEHPLEGERLTRLWAMTSDWDLDPIREAWIAHRAVEFDARMREAELAVLADDPARCERASQADDLSVFYCDRGPKIARAGRRLASLRS